MADHIHIRQSPATWVVRTADAVIAESQAALEMSEGDYPAVIYFPREDVAMAFLEKSDKLTRCPYKGDATHYSVSVPGATLDSAAWSYEDPKPEMAQIAGHLAFYTNKVNVEKL